MLGFLQVQNIAKAQRFFKILIVALLSWRVTPHSIIVYVSSMFIYLVDDDRFVTFLIVNAIVICLVVVYWKNSADLNCNTSDILYKYFQLSEGSYLQTTRVENNKIIRDTDDLATMEEIYDKVVVKHIVSINGILVNQVQCDSDDTMGTKIVHASTQEGKNRRNKW